MGEPLSMRPENVPYRPHVNACENDTPGLCTCVNCRAWDGPDPAFATHPYWGLGVIPHRSERFTLARTPWARLDAGEPPSLSDRYARFYVELRNEARQIDPDARVAGYAYANYWEAPVDPDLDLNGVLILHVPPLWFPYTEQMSTGLRESWDGWHRLGTDMIFRPNLTHAGANLPIFYARRLAADFSYLAARGLVGTRFDSLLGAWSAQGPTLYTLARMHARPDLAADQMLDEYYAAFGPAESGVRAYFGYWERHSDALDPVDVRRYRAEESGGGFKNYVRIAHRLYTATHFDEAQALLNTAAQQAAGNTLAEQRVAFLQMGLADARLTRDVRQKQAHWETAPSYLNWFYESQFNTAFSTLRTHRQTMEGQGIFPLNLGTIAFREVSGSGWPWPTQ